MSNRLPIPGGDNGNWGDILNAYLEVSLYNNPNNGSDPNNGTLNSGVVGTAQLQANSVTNAQLDVPTQTVISSVASKYVKPAEGIPSTDLASAVQTNLTSASTALQPGTTVGGDLTGTLPNPTIAKLQGITLTTGTPANNQVLSYSTAGGGQWVPSTVSSTTVNNATGSAPGIVQLSGDLGGGIAGSATSPEVTSTHLSSALPINQGGTGSTTQNFVDLSTTQSSIGGNKTFTGNTTFSNTITGNLSGNAATATTATSATTATTASTVTTVPALTGDVTTSGSSNATTLANTSAVQTVVNNLIAANTNVTNKAPIASPTFTGKVTTPALQVTTGSGTANQVLTSDTSGNATWATPASAPVSSVFTRTGAVVAASGDYTAAQVTNAADKSSGSTQTFTGNVSAPAVVASGLSGATAASRYVGATTSGAPASGTFVVGDFVIDQTAKIWVCTSSGSPGTWAQITAANGGVTSFNSRSGAVTPTSGDYTAAQVTGALVNTNNLSDVSNAATARGNLTAAKSGANSDITSLTGLTTALPVSEGGTGAGTLTGLVVGNGSSAMTAVSAPNGTVVGTTDTQTISSKRVTKRVVAVTQSATPAIDTDNMDVASITGLAQAITSMSTSSATPAGNLTGTPVDGDSLIVRITDNGSAQTINWGSSFEASSVALPTTTIASTMLIVGFIWHTTTSAWRCVAVA